MLSTLGSVHYDCRARDEVLRAYRMIGNEHTARKHPTKQVIENSQSTRVTVNLADHQI